MSRTSEDNQASPSPLLTRAASDGDVQAVNSQLAAGADVNATNQGGQTALMLAALMGNLELVACLLEAGANPQLQDRLGLTALEWSTRRGFSEVSQLLTKVSPPLHGPKPRTASPSARSIETKPQPSILNDLNAERLDRGRKAPSKISSAISDAEVLGKGQALTPQAEAIPFEGPGEAPAVATDSAPSAPTSVAAQSQSQRLAVDSALRPPPTTEQPTVADSLPSAPPATPVESQSQRFAVDSAPQPSSTIEQPQDARPMVREVPAASATESKASEPDRGPAIAHPPAGEQLLRREEEEEETLTRPRIPAPNRDVPLSKSVTPPLASTPVSEPAPTRAAQPPQREHAPAFQASPLGLSTRSTGSDSPEVYHSKRCPKCNTVYQNTPLLYCTRDYATLIDFDPKKEIVEEKIQSHSATAFQPVAAHSQSSTPVAVWLLIAFVLGASAFGAYRLTEYFSGAEAPSPVAALPVEAPVETKKPFFSVGGALAGMEVSIPEPEYPAEAQGAGIAGPITVRVRVNRNGRVISAAAAGGDQRLRAAALKAARQATFAPEKLAEVSPRSRVVSGSITYEFAPQSAGAATSPAPLNDAGTGSESGTTSTETGASTAAPNVDPNSPVVDANLTSAAISVPAAEYPSRARRSGTAGTITVTIRVNRAGRVVSWRSSDGDAQLRAAAVKAARKASFSREKLPGSGDVVGTITYNFTP
ncbi:MAG: TonB family protein [Pyrinomonadaceae bacterium]